MNDPAQLFGLIALQNVILFSMALGLFWAGVLVLRVTGRKYSYSLKALGIRRPADGASGSVLKGFASGLALFFLSLPIFGATAWVFRRLGYAADNSAQEPIFRAVEQWTTREGVLAALGVVLVVAVMTPVVEEFVNRGAIFGGLRWAGRLLSGKLAPGKDGAASAQRVATVAAAVVSSAIFATIHLSPVLVPGLFTIAMVFCWLYARTDSLLSPIVAHGTFNFCTISVITAGVIFA